MKTVLFFRHGKSDWDADYGADHERPLAKRGRKAAAAMGRFLAQAGPLPDRILTSSAVRARETLDRAMRAGGWDDRPVRVTRSLYGADPGDLLGEVRKERDDARTLLLVGHEPTWSEAVSEAIGGGRLRFPTAALARVDFPADHWADVSFGTGELVWFVIPKILP